MTGRSQQRRFVAVGATIATAAAAAFGVLSATSAYAEADPPEGVVMAAGGPTAVPGSYLVVLKDEGVRAAGTRTAEPVEDTAQDLTEEHGGTVRRAFGSVLDGFEARLSEQQARRMAADPAVAFVEQNHVVRAADTQNDPPSYGLDRIDQPTLPLDQRYTFPNRGQDVTAFVIDSGIQVTHADFEGRAVAGFDAIEEDGTAQDCDGHGTHVAGTIGGAAHGVAKSVKLVAVRVLDCEGLGTNAGVIDGLDFAIRTANGRAVANMSLSSLASEAVDQAVERTVAAGITVVAAAGNNNSDACGRSPARVPAAVTVGATDHTDRRGTNQAGAFFSNFGRCLDLFAPGVNIQSAWIDSDESTRKLSGTSMAAPHVAGVAAIILQAHPGASPDEVIRRLVNAAVVDAVRDPGPESPNRLLQVARYGG
jgi:subtilisin family serine protease